MAPKIEVSQAAHDRLIELAGRLFSVSEAVDRLLDSVSGLDAPPKPTERSAAAAPAPSNPASHRAPRERGIDVRIDGHRISAVTVPDLFLQFLTHAISKGLMARLDEALPYRTSNQRYLIAKAPIHPNGNPFVKPVEYKGYYMEAHKNYQNAMSGLMQLAKIGRFKIE